MAALIIISMGWGVQSWTMGAMVALGELPPVDYVVHSDTTWEHQHTYQFAAQWGTWLESHGVKVVTVSADNTDVVRHYANTEGDYSGVAIPAFTVNGSKNGQVRRQCTHDWKIEPVRRFVSDELARRKLQKSAGIVEQWLGITTDEWQRAKDSDVKYITHRYPLLDMGMSRADCINWLQDNNLPIPGKSSCTFCPYHSRAMWQQLKRSNGADWAQAVAVDEAIRDKRPPYPLFVHIARIPIVEAVQIPEDYGAKQLGLELDVPCDSGYCFL